MRVLLLLTSCFVLFCGATCSPLVVSYEVKPASLREEKDNYFLLNKQQQLMRLSFRQYHYYGNVVNNVFMARLENRSSDTLFTEGKSHFLHIYNNDGQIDTAKLNAQIAMESGYILPHAEMLFHASYRNSKKTKAKKFYRAARNATLNVCLEYRVGRVVIRDSFYLTAEKNG